MKSKKNQSRLVELARRLLPDGPFSRGVALLASGTAVGQLLVVVASPILTRLYTPEDFGVLAAYVGILGTIGAAGALKYEVAIPLPERRGVAANVFVAGVTTVIATCLLVATVLWGAQAILDDGWHWEGLRLSVLVWLLPLGLLGSGLYQLCKYWAIRTKRYSSIARTKISRSTGQVAIQIGCGLANYTPIGLLLGHFAGQSSGIATFLKEMWRRDRARLRDVTVRRTWLAGRRYWRFPAYAAGAGVILNAGLHVTPLLFVGLYGSQVAGWFALAERVTKGPARLIGQAVAQVYFSEIASLADEPRRMQGMMTKIAGRLALIIIAPAVALAISGQWLFGIVFGAEWVTAGAYAQYLSLVLFVNFVTSPVSQHLNVLERQDLMMLWSVVRFVTVVGALVVPWWLNLGHLWAVALYAIASSACYGALYVVNHFAIKARIASKHGPS